ncbi:MAG: NTP transferase domain-containing protein [candidate division Zixibacteria bacterium]|nr:NTP transferase domain-containing protein [candidate division Zixibacteria bacterium]
MKSDLPKVLHDLKGKPIIKYLADTLKDMGLEKAVFVVGYKREMVEEALADYGYDFALQEQQLGTGHAVMMAEEALSGFEGNVIVLAGDVPFIRRETLESLIDLHEKKGAVATVLTSEPPDPSGYGRVVKNAQDFVEKIVEHKDCSEEELKIGEINTGMFVFRKRELFENLRHIDNSNAQGEYYLTDLMEIFLRQGKKTAAFKTDDYREALGINSREQLEDLAKAYNL